MQWLSEVYAWDIWESERFPIQLLRSKHLDVLCLHIHSTLNTACSMIQTRNRVSVSMTHVSYTRPRKAGNKDREDIPCNGIRELNAYLYSPGQDTDSTICWRWCRVHEQMPGMKNDSTALEDKWAVSYKTKCNHTTWTSITGIWKHLSIQSSVKVFTGALLINVKS